MKNIPILNIYYLLVYAWDRLEEKDIAIAGVDGVGNATDLLAKMLETATRRLLLRGLDRGYTETEDTIGTVRGQIDVGVTIRQDLMRRGRVHCRFAELSRDIAQNQIIKATVALLLPVTDLHKARRDALIDLHARLGGISEPELTPELFNAMRFHRYDGTYELAMDICRLVLDSAMPDESGGMRLSDFVRDPRKMRILFQFFVRNFYKREQRTYKVSAPHMHWYNADSMHERQGFVPRLETDVVLESPTRSIIIDTKFTEHAFAGNRGAETLTSDHLNQLFAYLRNYVHHPKRTSDTVEGMLIYPKTRASFHKTFHVHGHRVTAHSVDLSRPWREIHTDLQSLISPEVGSAVTPSMAPFRRSTS